MATRLGDLTAVHGAVWTQLRLAVVAANRHEWRLATVATLAPGNVPDARTVVLREVDEAAGTITFFTDARSPKVAQIEACPQGAMVMHSRALAWQLRVRCTMSVATSGRDVDVRLGRLIDEAPQTLADYSTLLAPGTHLETFADAVASTRMDGAHFAVSVDEQQPSVGVADEQRSLAQVVTCRVLSMDWLELHPLGHRRAEFVQGGAAAWLAP